MSSAFTKYLTNLPKTPLVDAAKALYEADDRMGGSAWDDVERIHVYHAANPRMDMDIKLDSLWATRQKDSATRQDVIDRFVEDAQDFNRWLLSSKDGGALITSAVIKFKGDQDEVTVKIPRPGDGQSTDKNNLYESVEDTALTPFDDAIDIAKVSYDRCGGMDYEPEEGEDEESRYTVVKNTVDCIYGEMEEQLKSKGTVTVYRALSAKEVKGIRMDYLGESWSLYEDTAIEFGSHNGSNFILKAEAGLDAIDLERTWEVAGACADMDEYEVCIEDTDRLKDLHIGRIVKRTAVYDIK